MYKNGLSYGKCTAIVLITHIVMLAAILLRGKYENPQQIIPLAVAVIGLDIVYFFQKNIAFAENRQVPSARCFW